jgi:hypothetical protein
MVSTEHVECPMLNVRFCFPTGAIESEGQQFDS